MFTIEDPNFMIALRYICMVLAKKLDQNCLGFLIVPKGLFVITEVTVAGPNFIIALGYISMVLAK
jgi:hypothetical protein